MRKLAAIYESSTDLLKKERTQELLANRFNESKARSQDDPDALYELAVCYLRGEGVQQDIAKAIELLEQAVNVFGHVDAKVTLRDITIIVKRLA